MALEMKYFVLKPGSKKIGDRFAKASRAAMMKFADEIADADPVLAQELKMWAEKEEIDSISRNYAPAYPWHPTESDLVPSPWKLYRKTATQEMRPYIPGEDLSGVSVNKEDTPEPGGMIARNSDNHEDQWYVAKAFFEKNYTVA